VGGRLEPRFHLQAPPVEIVPADAARQRVPGGRALILDGAVDLDAERPERRQIEVRVGIVGAEIADAGPHPETELARGRPGDDAERAALGVAAEQGALRPLEDLDPLDVEQRRAEAVLAAEVDAVHIDSDALLARGLVGVEGNDAAYSDGERGRPRLEGGDSKPRDRAVGEIAEALDVTVDERLRVEH
jgi:hypothetical protein